MELNKVILKASKGDTACQRQLFDLHAPLVMRVCQRYSSNTDQAREYFQECFYQILTSLGRYKSEKGHFEGWLYKLSYYTILNIKKKEVHFFDIENIQNIGSADGEEAFEAEGRLDPEMIVREMQYLPEGYRLILNLYVFEGLTHEEIAQTLNISSSTSRSQLARARASLKKRLQTHKPLGHVSRSI